MANKALRKSRALTVTDFDQICAEYQEATCRKEKRRIGCKFRDVIGHRLNEHGVFTLPNCITIIKHKTVEVILEYVKTPRGTMAVIEYQFRTGCCMGSCSPITFDQLMKKDFVDDLGAFVRNKVIKLADSVENEDVADVAKNCLQRYIKQTEQASLFDSSEVAVLN